MATPTWFNEQYYLRSKLAQLQSSGSTEFTTMTQVREAIENAGFTLEQHFLQFGLTERTSPSKYFYTQEYLEAKAQQLNS